MKRPHMYVSTSPPVCLNQSYAIQDQGDSLIMLEICSPAMQIIFCPQFHLDDLREDTHQAETYQYFQRSCRQPLAHIQLQTCHERVNGQT